MPDRMDFMARALELGRRGVGLTNPNPSIGAVVVKDGQVVGEGFTQAPGQGHAEVIALRQAGDRARGATLYVTLEPCAHFGRTPPCVRAIIAAGIAEAHFPFLDPNPLINGKGRAELEAAGIRCVVGEHRDDALRAIEAHLKWAATGLPFVTAKFATSLDGKIATHTGESRWITGEAARARAHELRRSSDAVVVGIGTVLADDPQLTARDPQGQPYPRQPLRVIVDSTARTPSAAQILRQPGTTLIAVAKAPAERVAALEAAGAKVVAFPAKDRHVNLVALLHWLGANERPHVLVEGGGALLGSLFHARLVDKVAAFMAPAIIGGKDAPTPVEGAGFGRMSDVPRLQEPSVERLGDDVLITGYTPEAIAFRRSIDTRASGSTTDLKP